MTKVSESNLNSFMPLTEALVDTFTYLTNDIVQDVRLEVLNQLKTQGYTLPLVITSSYYNKLKLTNFHIFDTVLDFTIERTYTDAFSRQTTTRTESKTLAEVMRLARDFKNKSVQQFLKTLSQTLSEINKQHRPSIGVRRDNNVFELITPEIAAECQQTIKKIKYRIPLVDTYEFDVDKNGEPLTNEALNKLEQINANFTSLPFADAAIDAGLVENRPSEEDTNYNIEHSWAAAGFITFSCPISELSKEVQDIIKVAKVKKDLASTLENSTTTSCYRLANALIKYFDNDVLFFEKTPVDNSTDEVNDEDAFFLDFKEPATVA